MQSPMRFGENRLKKCREIITSNVSLHHHLLKCQYLKATTENKTSVTTDFKKLTTGNNVLIASADKAVGVVRSGPRRH